VSVANIYLVDQCSMRSALEDGEVLQTLGQRYLGASELERSASLKAKRKVEFVCSRILLRQALSHYHPTILPEQWQLEERPDLPPEGQQISRAKLFFSISHSRDYLAIAVAAGQAIGLDIEYCRDRDVMAIAEEWFHPNAVAALKALKGGQRLRAFYRHWTANEAFIKLHCHSIFSTRSQGLYLSEQREADSMAYFSFANSSLANSPLDRGDYCLSLTGQIPAAQLTFLEHWPNKLTLQGETVNLVHQGFIHIDKPR
jgi:phosphopantetheinyl transferase